MKDSSTRGTGKSSAGKAERSRLRLMQKGCASLIQFARFDDFNHFIAMWGDGGKESPKMPHTGN
jgi:hypothetical protein